MSRRMNEGIAKQLYEKGYAFIPSLTPSIGTKSVANRIGLILEISKLKGHELIPNIQTLKPREINCQIKNQYSGNYGFGIFPLHTDLAHWSLPPRYLLLRCIKGTKSVSTYIMSSKSLDKNLLKKAIVKPRRNTGHFNNCMLPVSFNIGTVQGVRWDSLFLEPLNSAAERLFEILRPSNMSNLACEIVLTNPGDTIIIDNWKMIHGRGVVNKNESSRVIERVYLTDIKG